MGKITLLVFLVTVAACSALPTKDEDRVIRKYSEERYQHVVGPKGQVHLVDLWMKASDLQEAARFTPDTQNVYHLFTRANPTVSQPLLLENDSLLGSTNYDPRRRTILILHGWIDSAAGDLTSVLVPANLWKGWIDFDGILLAAYLSAEDCNVVSVDWSAGAGTINYIAAVANTVTSGVSVARFINWLNRITGAVPAQYHLVGHSLGAHQAGIIGRNMDGKPAYITGLDPAFPGWITHGDKFRADDGAYTEIIHTNSGLLGYLSTLGHVDFYPNGGINMPGCNSQECDHERCFHYLAESLTSAGFTGRRCTTYVTAMTGNCYLWGSLRMGGLVPKTGSTGIYYLQTNAAPPFSMG